MSALRWTLLAAALFGAAAPGRADVIFSLTPSRPLSSLAVGDSVGFAVGVNLTGGEVLDTLTTKILFTNGAFTLSPGTAGPIVPNPADFFSTTGTNNPPGFDFVDGAFFLPIGPDISTSGTFFNFNAVVRRAGTVVIRFDPASTTAFTATGGTPNIQLPPAQTSQVGVPEPTTLLAWSSLLALAGLRGLRRRMTR